MGLVKSASTSSEREKAASLLSRIYQENPNHWPYGLGVNHFDPGDLFLVYKSASEEPVGFVGWQSRMVENVKAGFYSIGILPENRGQGVARSAIQQLLKQKSAQVDRVFALVVDGNTPSEKLAARLNIPVVRTAAVKQANWKSLAKPVASGLGGAVTTGIIQDNIMNPDNSSLTSLFDFQNNGKHRNIINTINMAMGAGGGVMMQRGAAKAFGKGMSNADRKAGLTLAGKGFGAATVAPIFKDLALDAHRAVGGVHALGKEAPNITKALMDRAKATATGGSMAGAGLMAAALGLGGYGIAKAIRDKEPSQINMQQGGRLRVTLPTKNPNDAETVVELPYDPQEVISSTLHANLLRDMRRRLRAESKSRTHRRGSSLQALTGL